MSLTAKKVFLSAGEEMVKENRKLYEIFDTNQVIKSQIRFFFYSVCGDKDPNNNLHYNGSR
jgi:hypothetical protein